MKLSEYFQGQKKQQIKTQLKNEIFFRIQKEKLSTFEKSKTLSPNRFFFATKNIHYISLASLVILFVFGGIFFEKYIEKDFGGFSIQQGEYLNGVKADYVAEIVDFNGEYTLKQGNKIYTSTEIKNQTLENISINNGDVIKLQEGSEMLFNLLDGTQARIDGPAEFSIIQENDGYKIYINEGMFFRIYCPECQSDIDIITPDTSIHQEKDQKLDIQIANNEGDLLVKNNGDAVVVLKKNKDNIVHETKILSTESVSIDSKTNTIDVLGDSELMDVFMLKNNISGTFTLSVDNVEWPKFEVKSTSVDGNKINKEEKTENILEENSDIGGDLINSGVIDNIEEKDNQVESQIEDPILGGIIDVITSDKENAQELDDEIILELGISNQGPQVPSEAQMQVLKSNLNSFFLMNTFEDIYTKEKMSQGISNLADRVNSISIGFGYSDRAKVDLFSIKSTVSSLKIKLQKERYIAPSYIAQLDKIMNWCDELSSHSSADSEDIKDSRKKLQENLPYYLKLM